jgi:hypothetical protein
MIEAHAAVIIPALKNMTRVAERVFGVLFETVLSIRH